MRRSQYLLPFQQLSTKNDDALHLGQQHLQIFSHNGPAGDWPISVPALHSDTRNSNVFMRLLHDPLDSLGWGVAHKRSSESSNPSFKVVTQRSPASTAPHP